MHIPGIDDELFIRGKVPMTKQEVRMITLCKAAIKENDIVLDIGAGTGSLSIEAALMAVQGHVYAVERNPEAVGLIKQNAVKFKVTANVSIIEGLAPDALKGIDNYDVVFIGGSGGNLEEILDVVSAHINPGGRIIANAITLQNVNTIIEYMKKNDMYDYESVLIQASRLKKAGPYDMMIAMNPVYVITCTVK
ncbi:precorrin-6Y C5,15-methyltransferase (decarboxylating) subunit CbiT [Pectinatus brassicae]|uniref:Precorrin-6Y C5,15-methyltransferase (Decarboxylating) CbiT subunit n=1 Tax=Pectinatus brassicae TaxID=862415 RepID=A0A840UJU5_9FIRM|nr:precorrin-6Y C5,15-methyltransferase (decarboxylating) subunit CbiT [Pectinatus brassicae]MBB5337416.1 precorrin-6Y C5,15-methyltransferase (decarboxylating) CbiT subunit [Pectinatus brassicae]